MTAVAPVLRGAGVVVVTLALSIGVPASPATGQDPSAGTTTSIAQVPSQDIVPAPNSGEEPDDAGDRGGALQLALLGLLALGIGGAVAVVVRQSRRARSVEGG
jgi:hypothetical protein